MLRPPAVTLFASLTAYSAGAGLACVAAQHER